MIKIIKNKEPKEWEQYRNTPGVQYQSKEELRESLLKEQGYICAYCMRRIPTRDNNSTEKSRVEHILCREVHPEMQLDYQNMVICCPGAINNDSHCDKKKGNNDITFDLFTDSFFRTLSYKTKSAIIESSNDEYDKEINEILNLNNKLLARNRLEILKGVISYLNSKSWNKATINKILEKWENKDQNGKYKSYCGIVIWFLRKKLERINN